MQFFGSSAIVVQVPGQRFGEEHIVTVRLSDGCISLDDAELEHIDFTPALHQLTDVSSLALMKNHFRQLPSSILQFTSLAKLRLSTNPLEDLLPMNFPHLRSLALARTKIKNCLALSSLASLTKLEVQESDIETLNGIETLTELRVLWAYGCPYLVSITAVRNLSRIDELHLGFDPLPSFCYSGRSMYNDTYDRREEIVALCDKHHALAHLAVVDWIIAMAGLELPAYVLLHVFDCLCESELKTELSHSDGDEPPCRVALSALAVPPQSAELNHFDRPYFNICVQDRSHVQNIKLIIAVYKSIERVKQISAE